MRPSTVKLIILGTCGIIFGFGCLWGVKSTINNSSIAHHNESLRKELQETRKTIKELEEKLKIQIKPDLNKELDKASFELDFEKMNVFSIERVIREDRLITVVGFWNNKGELVQWYLRCSEAEHERLIGEFRRHKERGF